MVWRHLPEGLSWLDGWVKTGDVATRDEDGYVYTIDRIKDMPILADENVYLAAIENVILAHPSGAVIGQPSDRWGRIAAGGGSGNESRRRSLRRGNSRSLRRQACQIQSIREHAVGRRNPAPPYR